MKPNDLPTSTLDRRQSPPRRDIIAGSVTAEERAAILGAYEQAGFRNISEGCRLVNTAFAASAEVRDAVAKWCRLTAADQSAGQMVVIRAPRTPQDRRAVQRRVVGQ